jgi:hypothetical protein
MTRDEFKKVVDEALETLVATAEQRLDKKFPRQYCLSGFGSKEVVPGDAVEFLTNWVFVDEDHIYPCVDLFLEEMLPDGPLLFRAYRAGFKPCAYGEKNYGAHDSGSVWPFKLTCNNFVQKMGGKLYQAPGKLAP